MFDILSLRFKKVIGLLCSTALLCALASCNDAPTAVGSDIVIDSTIITKVASSADLPLIEKITVERIGQVRFGDILKNLGFGNTTILTGGTTTGQKAYAFLNIGRLADSLKNIDAAKIISTTLILQPTKYALGDTASQFSFSVHEMKEKRWNNIDTLESIFTPTGVKPEYFDEATSVASFKGNVDRTKDSLSVEVSLPNTLTAKWFTTSDSSTGLALAPDAASVYIQQFKALNSDRSSAMNVRIIYTSADGQDTLLLPVKYHGTFVNAAGAASPSDIIIQNGTAYRTAFDFDLTPIEQNASIHSVKFFLTLDSAVISSNRQRVLLIERIANASGGFNDILAATGTSTDATPRKYEFPGLTARIERWLRGTRKGRLYIAMENESETADRITFYNITATDTTLRPRLEILYSTRPVKP